MEDCLFRGHGKIQEAPLIKSLRIHILKVFLDAQNSETKKILVSTFTFETKLRRQNGRNQQGNEEKKQTRQCRRRRTGPRKMRRYTLVDSRPH